MRRLIPFALLALVPFLATPSRAEGEEGVKATGQLILQVGKSYPIGEIGSWLGPGTAYRLKVFGGARLPKISWLGGVGLGWDLSYSTHGPKATDPGFAYKKFTWDWLYIPISFAGILHFTPGLSWVLTDVKAPAQGIQEVSVRPAGTVTLGISYPILPFMSVRADGRWEHAVADLERGNDGFERSVTGSFLTAFAGLDFQF